MRTFYVSANGKMLTVKLMVVFSFFTFNRLRTRATLAFEKKNELELLFNLDFALYLVNFYKKTAPLGFQKVMGIDRSLSYTGVGEEIPQTELLRYPRSFPLGQSCIDRHLSTLLA